jgi:hypothetical protein
LSLLQEYDASASSASFLPGMLKVPSRSHGS